MRNSDGLWIAIFFMENVYPVLTPNGGASIRRVRCTNRNKTLNILGLITKENGEDENRVCDRAGAECYSNSMSTDSKRRGN